MTTQLVSLKQHLDGFPVFLLEQADIPGCVLTGKSQGGQIEIWGVLKLRRKSKKPLFVLVVFFFLYHFNPEK